MWNLLQFSEINKDNMKKKPSLIISLVLINSALVFTQPEIPEILSFDKAISLAVQNNPDLKIKDIDNLIASEQYNEARLKMFPQIYGRYDLQRNLIIPSTLVPVGKFNPDLPPDELTPIKFGTNWASVAGLFASVKIFNPDILGDIREKKATMKLSDLERKITQTDIETETGKAYANCLLSFEQLEFAKDDTVNSHKQMEVSYFRFNSGSVKQTELNQAILNHSNSVSRFNESSRIYADSRKTLAYWIGIEDIDIESVKLSDSLDLLINRLETCDREKENIRSSLTLQKLDAINNIDNIRLKNTKAGFLPAITLNGLLSTDYYNNLLRLGNGEYWFGNSNINISLHLPITEGIDRTKKIRQQKYQIDANRQELKSELNRKMLDMQRISDDIEFFKKEIVFKRSALALAKTNYEASFSLYSEGRILPSELTEAEISYKQIKIDYLKALYNYLDSLLERRRIIQS